MNAIQTVFARKFPHADAIDASPGRIVVRQHGKRAATWTSSDNVTWTSDAPPWAFVVRP